MQNITVGKDENNYAKINTRINEIYHYKSLAENLQMKYPKIWKENRNIKQRIRAFHSKAKRIAEDFARKVGKRIVDEAIKMNANVIKLENLRNLIKNVKKLPKKFRNKLYLMQYRKIQYWIDWQSKKHGLLVKYVYAAYSSVKCPKCTNKMKEISYRLFKCSCGYENDRDIIAIENLNGGFSEPLDCPSYARCSYESIEGNSRPLGRGEVSYISISSTFSNLLAYLAKTKSRLKSLFKYGMIISFILYCLEALTANLSVLLQTVLAMCK